MRASDAGVETQKAREFGIDMGGLRRLAKSLFSLKNSLFFKIFSLIFCVGNYVKLPAAQ
jgi:hypothetical protein